MCVSECLHADCGPHLGLSMNDVQKQASHCNDKKTVSKRVQELSSELFFGVFVKVGNQIINQHVDNKQDTWGTREQYFYCSSREFMKCGFTDIDNSLFRCFISKTDHIVSIQMFLFAGLCFTGLWPSGL